MVNKSDGDEYEDPYQQPEAAAAAALPLQLDDNYSIAQKILDKLCPKEKKKRSN